MNTIAKRQKRQKITNSTRVLVRAYEDEPVSLISVGGRAGVVRVAKSEDAKAVVGFRQKNVFVFDETLFAQLLDAFNCRNAESLQKLWGKAQPFQPESKG